MIVVITGMHPCPPWIVVAWSSVALVSVSSCGRGPAIARPAIARLPSVIQVGPPALFPESIVRDDRDGRLLIGSFRDGGVYELLPSGATRALVQDDRLISVLGIGLDPARGRVLVASSDLGVARRASAQGVRKHAALGVYDLTSGAPIHYVDLGALRPDRLHLANGLAVDPQGNAYVTDSLAPLIYRVTADGDATVLLEDAAFEGVGINLNGVVYHPDGFLLVVKKNDGRLFRVPLDDSRQWSEVQVPRPLIGADGVVLAGRDELVVIANEVDGQIANEVVALASRDGWRTATISGVRSLDRVYPTSALLDHGTISVLHSGLDQLIGASPATIDQLQNVAVLEAVAAPAAAVTREVIERVAVPGTGNELRLMRVTFPPGAASPPHRHPAPGLCYVLEGTAESQYEGEALTTLHAGDSYQDSPDRPHLVFRNPSATTRLRFTCAATLGIDQPFFQPR